MQVEVQLDVGDRGLGRFLVAQQGLFVVCAKLLRLLVSAVLVPDIGVDEDEDAQAHEGGQGHGADEAGCALEPARQAPDAGHEAGLGPAPPQAVSQDQQKHRSGRPVGLGPQGVLPEIAAPVHVRQGHADVGAIAVEHMVEAHRAQDDGRDQIDHHDGPADELVGRQGLHHNGQDGDHAEAQRARQDVPHQVLADLEVEHAARDLHADAGDHADDQDRGQDQDQGQGLGQQEGPVGGRRGVDQLVDLAVAVAPDQLAGIVDGHDHRDEAERALKRGDHHARHQIDRGAVDLARDHQDGDGEGQAHQHQDDIGRALEHKGHLEAGAGPQLGPAGLEAIGGLGQGSRRRRLGRGGRQGLELVDGARLGAPRSGLIEPVGGGQNGQADARPKQAVAQEDARQGHVQDVALGRGPVLGHQGEGGRTEGLGPGHDLFKFGLGTQDAGRHHIGDEDPDHADIGRHHRTGHGRQGEEEGRGQEDGRQAHHRVGIQVVARPEGPHGLLVDPGRQGAGQDADRHAQEAERAGRKGAGEAAVQVVEARQPGGLDDGAKARLHVAHHHIGHDHSRSQHEEGGHHQLQDRQRIGGVLVDIAPGTDVDIGHGDHAEAEQGEEDGDDPEGGLAQLITEFESGDLEEHGLTPRLCARR